MRVHDVILRGEPGKDGQDVLGGPLDAAGCYLPLVVVRRVVDVAVTDEGRVQTWGGTGGEMKGAWRWEV